MAVQHEQIRNSADKLDEKFRQIASELDNAYYNFWKNNQSQPFYGFDVRANANATRKQFELLHGAVWHFHLIMFHKLNIELGSPIDQNQYRLIGTKDRVQDSRNWIKDKSAQYSVDITPIKTRLENLFSRIIAL